jgi:hypothetical protein
MGRLVTCGDEIVWKYVFGEQNSEIYRVSEEVGVGYHAFIKYGHDPMEDEEVSYVEVDPSKDEFEADILRLKKSDLKKLRVFIEKNTKKPSLFQRILGKKPNEDFFVSMIAAFADYVEKHGDIELHGEM